MQSDGDTFRLLATAARPPTSPQVQCTADTSRPEGTLGCFRRQRAQTANGADEGRDVNGCSHKKNSPSAESSVQRVSGAELLPAEEQQSLCAISKESLYTRGGQTF